MSNQPYDEAKIIQEIIETLKHGSKSRFQIRQDLLARGIPANELDRLIQSAAHELYPEDNTLVKPSLDDRFAIIGRQSNLEKFFTFVKPPLEEQEEPNEAGVRNCTACLLFILVPIVNFSFCSGYQCYLEYTSFPESLDIRLWLPLIIQNLMLLSVIGMLGTYTNNHELSVSMKFCLGILSIIMIPMGLFLSFLFLLACGY
jgi:hypothetical protein